jgi:serine/threonine-protein phosphatase 6 regulatory ankyrin repeat subunit B
LAALCSADIEAKTLNDGYNALHYAVVGEHAVAVQLSFENGVNINAKNWCWATALHFETSNGHSGITQLLLGKMNDIRIESKDYKKTALYYASHKGHEDVVYLLLKKGASTEARTEDGMITLHIATLGGHLAVVRLLVENGRDIETKTEDGWTALYNAVSMGYEKVARLLLENGATYSFTYCIEEWVRGD